MSQKRPSALHNERCLKFSHSRAPRLLTDILLLIFLNLSIRDLRNASQVSKAWKKCVDNNAAKIWCTRCETLGLLSMRLDRVLGVSVQDLLARALPLQERLFCDNLSEEKRYELNYNLAVIY